jgi:hypothetical protein
MCVHQARFARLCSVMSGMYHRHTGYLFGSLVDFANDSMGRELAFYWYRFWKITINSVRPLFPTVIVDVLRRPNIFTVTLSNPYEKLTRCPKMHAYCPGIKFINISFWRCGA